MNKEKYKYVTLGRDMRPVISLGDGYILPKKADLIINSEYYQMGEGLNERPRDPDNGEKLPIEPMRKTQVKDSLKDKLAKRKESVMKAKRPQPKTKKDKKKEMRDLYYNK